MCISIHYTTSKSKYHEKNEDNYFIGDNFIIIADGMGGECNGDIASKIAVDTASQVLNSKLKVESVGNLKDLMFSAIKQADENILKYIDLHPESYGMGTTVLLMIYQDEMVSLAWCGDSRCYAYREGNLNALTKDHSYVQELIDRKIISIDESFSHPDNNLITRFVGGGETTCEPEYVDYKMKDSEIIVLCSDGLSGYCRETDIESVITSNQDFSTLPIQLKELAVEHGSDDDITIVIFAPSNIKYPQKRASLLDWFRRKAN